MWKRQEKERWQRKRSGGKVHSTKDNWCGDFETGCPSCLQPVLKTSTETHPFFKHQQTPEGRDVAPFFVCTQTSVVPSNQTIKLKWIKFNLHWKNNREKETDINKMITLLYIYHMPSHFLASPPEPKIPIILLACSHPLSDFIIVFFHCIYCFCVLFLCLLSTIVRPLAITFNKLTN